MRFVLYAILIYVLYQFVFKLVIPVYLASRRMKKGFAEMQRRMNEQMGQQQDFQPKASRPNPGVKPKSGDYIDFEEVK